MRPYIIAHRGVSQNVPENTLPAFRAAIALGADGVETDVQLTKDGKAVLHHNYTIDACSNGSGAICTMTRAELTQYDFGSWAGAQWAGTPIPDLDEFLDLTACLPVVNVELKAPVDRGLPYVELVVEALSRRPSVENVIISAFDHSLLAQVKALRPDVKVGALTLPAGFAHSRLFALLERYYPAGRLLVDATREDLAAMPANIFAATDWDIPGQDARDTLAELARQVGAVHPQSTLQQVKAALDAQNDLPAYVQSLGFPLDYLHCHYSAVLRDPGFVAKMRALGVECNVWTPDKPEELEALAQSGCHGIITNRPDLLKQIEGC